jgi:prophage regulatory protein
MSDFADPPERLLKLEEVTRRIGLGKSMIYRLVAQNRFLPPYKLSASILRWS